MVHPEDVNMQVSDGQRSPREPRKPPTGTGKLFDKSKMMKREKKTCGVERRTKYAEASIPKKMTKKTKLKLKEDGWATPLIHTDCSTSVATPSGKGFYAKAPAWHVSDPQGNACSVEEMNNASLKNRKEGLEEAHRSFDDLTKKRRLLQEEIRVEEKGEEVGADEDGVDKHGAEEEYDEQEYAEEGNLRALSRESNLDSGGTKVSKNGNKQRTTRWKSRKNDSEESMNSPTLPYADITTELFGVY